MGAFSELTIIQKFILWVLPVLLAIIVHEVAHGWVACYFGDKTAKFAGRLTLNPIKHVDIVGTIIVPVLLFVMQTGFLFGWAKPVPVDPRNFKKPIAHMAIVALAGPFSNVVMAFGWACLMKVIMVLNPVVSLTNTALMYMAYIGIFINLILAALNIIPIPPLDGSRILAALIPKRWVYYLGLIEPYGFFILIALLMTNILWFVLDPIISISFHIITQVVGVR